MAEAAIDMTTNMSQIRYFCHQCSQETSSVLPDYTCPRCRSGFIEELSHESDEQSNELFNESDDNNDRSDEMVDILDNLYGLSESPIGRRRRSTPATNGSNQSNLFTASNSQTNNRQDSGSADSSTGRHQNASSSNPQSPQSRQRTRYFQFNFPRGSDAAGFDNQQSLEGLFQHILTNVASGQFGGREGGVSVGGRGLINIDFPLPLFQVLHGNPGDYAWGQGGLDVVITQLLNQLDGTGPPPMAKEEIDRLPFVAITGEQVQKNLQCTVCMEDFKVGEKVRSLVCLHCYHNDCIVPWLQMHATCPVCRKELTPNRISNQGINRRSSHSDNQQTSENTNSNQSPSNATYESTDDYD